MLDTLRASVIALRLIVALGVVTQVSAGCGLLGGSKKSTKSAEGDEEGVRKINRTLIEFREALKKKDFDYATKHMRSALAQIRRASEITRGHPDFEDMELSVNEHQVRLERAIELDRIQRRNAVIDDLIARGDEATAAANRIYVELAQRVPVDDDLQRLDRVLQTLADLHTDGLAYLDDSRYVAHASDRDAKTKVVQQLRADTEVMLTAVKNVVQRINRAYGAVTRGRSQVELDERIQEFSAAASEFEACAKSIEVVEHQRLYEPSKLMATRLGKISIRETLRTCNSLAKQARLQIGSVRWAESVKEVIAAMGDAVERARNPGDATAELEYAREALVALDRCASELGRASRQAGYDPKRNFSTPLGELNAPRLAKACAKERGQIKQRLPQIEWRTTLASLQELAAGAKELIQQAAVSASGADKAAKLEQAISGLDACRQEATALSKVRGADRGLRFTTAFGSLTVSELAKQCQAEQKGLQRDLAEAKKQRTAEGFAQDVRGDEKDVIQREGVPTRIESYEGGRIFVYERFGKRGKRELVRIGFDKDGKRVDYTERWRQEVTAITGELESKLIGMRDAKSAQQKHAAAEGVLSALTVCQDSITRSKNHPGYSPVVSFDSPLGKLNATALVTTCGRKHREWSERMPTLGWRVRFEALRDDINQVQGKLNEVAALKDPDRRIELIKEAADGLQRCMARAKELPTQRGADATYEIDTVYGVLTVSAALDACATMLEDAFDAGEKAAIDREIAKFVKRCKGMEVDVAWREGIPSKVITFGDKRVFVYEKTRDGKRFSKRYAFDAEGKRIDEVALLADLSIEPEIEEVPMPPLEMPISRPPKR